MEEITGAGCVLLVRHGETDWSRARRHTGTTDIGLTAEGEAQGRALAPLLGTIDPVLVLTSPRRRAADTCRLAGFGEVARTDERLAEWDYGFAEGRTTAEIRTEITGWSVWTHDLPGGEALADVAARADRLIAELRSIDGPALLFGHAHMFRILAVRWCELPALAGRHLMLDPASVSTLGYERETPAITSWNVVAAPLRRAGEPAPG